MSIEWREINYEWLTQADCLGNFQPPHFHSRPSDFYWDHQSAHGPLPQHRLLLLKLDTRPCSHLVVEVCIQWVMSSHVYFTPPPPMWHPTPSIWHASFTARIGRQMVPPICFFSFNNRNLCNNQQHAVIQPNCLTSITGST